MASDSCEMDAFLGDTEELPPSLSLAKFVACRSQEIQIMKNSLIAKSGTKLIFQTIPKHMRRRAMAHNVKRLPRRLRQIHLNQMKKSGMPVKGKRPSRKYRRRPNNLTEDYTKRSSKRYKWLQTHIWHAKRFHMVEKWGYKLPYSPCDKAFRACYRAMCQHCLLQDLSYNSCIEIIGNRAVILEKFKRFSKSDSGLSIGAKAFIHGGREGKITLYEIEVELYQRAIGSVNFHWVSTSNDQDSKLWIWIHPAFYNRVLRLLNLAFEGLSNIKVIELRSELCRFRLTGPLSNSVLHEALRLLNIENLVSLPASLRDYILKPDNKEIIINQFQFWEAVKNLDSTSDIPPHSIISLLVTDPRLNLPKKRTKTVRIIEKTIVINTSPNLCRSLLCEEDFRKEMIKNKMSDSQIADIRTKLLVPGSDLEQNDTFVSIILVQRPGNRIHNLGLGGGWDVILPSAWAKPFWVAFNMRGARAGGLRESNSILFEMGRQQLLKPDTEAGIIDHNQTFKENVDKFFRKPPNKRINYNKFKIACPFSCNWKMLLREWGSDENFHVIRDKNILGDIDLFFKSKTQFVPDHPKNSVIPVKLECEKRGSPSQFAIICLPKSLDDFKRNVSEPSCADEFQKQRKVLRDTHKNLLKKYRKQRKTKSQSFKPEIYKEMLIKYTEKMRALWLPEPSTVKNSCSREVIGFVTKGGFSFSLAKGCGTGYIAAECLPELLKYRNKILIRNTNSRQYKVAKMAVILE